MLLFFNFRKHLPLLSPVSVNRVLYTVNKNKLLLALFFTSRMAGKGNHEVGSLAQRAVNELKLRGNVLKIVSRKWGWHRCNGSSVEARDVELINFYCRFHSVSLKRGGTFRFDLVEKKVVYLSINYFSFSLLRIEWIISIHL